MSKYPIKNITLSISINGQVHMRCVPKEMLALLS